MNAFGRWMEAKRLRNIDVAIALDVVESAAWRWAQDGYWPSTKAAALKLLRFTGGAVTPDMLLPTPPLAAITTSREAKLGEKAIRAAEARVEQERENAKASVNKSKAVNKSRKSRAASHR